VNCDKILRNQFNSKINLNSSVIRYNPSLFDIPKNNMNEILRKEFNSLSEDIKKEISVVMHNVVQLKFSRESKSNRLALFDKSLMKLKELLHLIDFMSFNNEPTKGTKDMKNQITELLNRLNRCKRKQYNDHIIGYKSFKTPTDPFKDDPIPSNLKEQESEEGCNCNYHENLKKYLRNCLNENKGFHSLRCPKVHSILDNRMKNKR